MNTSIFKSVAMAASFAAFFGNSAKAVTYTAVASGNFSSSATWLGGITPSSVLIADAVVVPSGITVTLDQNQQLNGVLSSIVVNGTLTSSVSAANSLVLTAGSLSGSGTLSVDSMVLGLSTGFGFTGNINTHKMISMGSTLSSSANINVSSMLELRNSILALNAGMLSLNSGATIVVSGGTMSTNGGTLSLTNGYNVMYQTNSATTGLELSGSGLANVEVNVPSSSAVTLGGNLTVKGMLTLTSGMLNTNNHDLLFVGNANVSGTGSGMISSTSGTNITFTSSASFTGGLHFSSTGNTVNNLTVNLSNSGSTVMLASDLNVNGMLSLQAGRIDIGGNSLMVNGSVSGGSSNSFVITGQNGRLVMSLGAGASNTYHIGAGANYAPAVVQGNTGSVTSMIGVGVNSSVYSEGTANNGVDLSQSQALVNATWFVTSTATANLNLNLQTMWSTNMEMNGFNRNQLYISHYTNANWDASATIAATAEANGMYSAKRNNITSLSPFAVMGKDAVTTAVGTVASAKNGLSVYPNPATNTINLVGNYTTGKIYSVNGTLVKAVSIARNTISVADLPAGFYTLQVQGDNTTATTSFVKQ